MEAANALFIELLKYKDLSYWNGPDLYPFMVPGNGPKGKNYEIKKVNAPHPPAAAPPLIEVDQARVRRLQEKDYVLKGAFEADHFYTGSVIGGKNERKAFAHAAFILDAASGFLFRPELGEASHSVGDILARVVLNAIEDASFLPAELRVKKDEFKTLLEPLAQQLGITVQVAKSLPAVERAKKHLFEFLGR